ncbi:MAG: hypothetical protein JWO86_2398 [Myxococcaceae bacterium]|nr:hypothetical protein [Myxococcaceae bacterium]
MRKRRRVREVTARAEVTVRREVTARAEVKARREVTARAEVTVRREVTARREATARPESDGGSGSRPREGRGCGGEVAAGRAAATVARSPPDHLSIGPAPPCTRALGAGREQLRPVAPGLGLALGARSRSRLRRPVSVSPSAPALGLAFGARSRLRRPLPLSPSAARCRSRLRRPAAALAFGVRSRLGFELSSVCVGGVGVDFDDECMRARWLGRYIKLRRGTVSRTLAERALVSASASAYHPTPSRSKISSHLVTAPLSRPRLACTDTSVSRWYAVAVSQPATSAYQNPP